MYVDLNAKYEKTGPRLEPKRRPFWRIATYLPVVFTWLPRVRIVDMPTFPTCVGFFPDYAACLSVCVRAFFWIPTPLAGLKKNTKNICAYVDFKSIAPLYHSIQKDEYLD